MRRLGYAACVAAVWSSSDWTWPSASVPFSFMVTATSSVPPSLDSAGFATDVTSDTPCIRLVRSVAAASAADLLWPVPISTYSTVGSVRLPAVWMPRAWPASPIWKSESTALRVPAALPIAMHAITKPIQMMIARHGWVALHLAMRTVTA